MKKTFHANFEKNYLRTNVQNYKKKSRYTNVQNNNKPQNTNVVVRTKCQLS